MSKLAGVLCILGFTGMTAQTLLLRELLTVFSGNELVIGTIFGFWMVGEAAGSLAAGRVCRRGGDVVSVYMAATMLFVALFPVAVTFARIGKWGIGIPHDVAVGTGGMLLISAVVVLPVALVHGFQFIASVAVAQSLISGCSDAVGRSYSLETLGSIGGGVATSLLFFPLLDSFQVAAILAFFNAAACLSLLYVRGCHSVIPVRGVLFATVMVVAAVLLATGGTKVIQLATISLQWGGMQPAVYRNSHYQNIAVMAAEGQYTLFADGNLLLSIPDPDLAYIEEFVHLPLLCHQEPRDILVLGGGVGGVIAELLRHPSVRRIDYVEPDPMILETLRGLPVPLASSELGDPRVLPVHGDAREFVRRGGGRYDVVLINFPLPETLQSNRFFTSQFYRGLDKLLAGGGIVAVPAPGSLTYYSDELARLNASLLATLKRSFRRVAIIPGEPNFYIAGSAATLEGLTPQLLAKRLGMRRIGTRLISAEHLDYRFSPEAREWFDGRIAAVAADANSDGDPRLLYLNLAYRSKMHGSPFSGLLELADSVNLKLLASVMALIVLAMAPLVWMKPVIGIPFAVAGTGFSAMLGELLLMYAFQVAYGSLFHSVGLLLALFMAGIAVGSWLAGRFRARYLGNGDFMLCLEGGLVAFFLVFAGYFAMIDRNVAASATLPAIVMGMLLVGMLTGATYPVASRLYGSSRGGGGAALSIQGAGAIYSADLGGGFLGGVAGVFLLLPALGMTGSCLALALVKFSTCVLLVVSRNRLGYPTGAS